MTERKSPTAVLHEGPRALSDQEVREIEESDLAGVLDIDIDDVIEYVHKDLKSLPDFTTLYRRVPEAAVGRLRSRLQPGQDRLDREDDRARTAVVHGYFIGFPPW